MGSRSFFNGATGCEEVWLWQESTQHELNGHTWTTTDWYVDDIDSGGRVTKHFGRAEAEADYEMRVNERVKATSNG